jgi:hypothetical protein
MKPTKSLLTGLWLVILTAPFLQGLTYSDSATLWAEYAASPETHPNIPNNSFAGYHRGEKPVPDVPVVANLLDYGGVGDGIYDNTEAFRQAIDAAYRAGGGAILIPAGEYYVDDMIQMHRSGVVLRGEGQASTSIVFGKPLLDVLGNPDPISTSRWNWMGGLIWMSPLTSFRRENTVHDFRPVYPEDFTTGTLTQEHWHQGPALASVLAEAPMGSRAIELDDASNLYEGQMVLMSWDNLDTFDLLYEVGGHPLMETADWGKWLTSQTYLPRWQWPVEISQIDGNTVTLAQPIRFATTAKYNCRIWDIGDSVSEAGVENLTIVLDAMNVLFHNQGLGWNAIFINQAYDCWVRNVDIINAENGVHITSAKGISVLNTQILGDRPCHHPYTSRLNSHDCLWDGFTIDYTGDGYCQHGINTEFLCSGHVWTRGDMEFGTMDSHQGSLLRPSANRDYHPQRKAVMDWWEYRCGSLSGAAGRALEFGHS